MSTDDLEDRVLGAVHDDSADLERLAHEVSSNEDAQAYLVELIETLSMVNPKSRAAERAAQLLEHAIAVAAEHGLVGEELEANARATKAINEPDER